MKTSLLFLSLAFMAVTAFGCANDVATPASATATAPSVETKTETQTKESAETKPVVETDKTKFAKRIAELTPLQYKVTQENGTERPFHNEFWDNKKAGIYLDIVSGEPLFSSTDKFKSGTGWPSFTQPLVKGNVVEVSDTTHGMVRVEVRSKGGDSHLGHVFTDGPKPAGLRYCINSASLEFVPVDKLEEKGLGEFKKLFSEAK